MNIEAWIHLRMGRVTHRGGPRLSRIRPGCTSKISALRAARPHPPGCDGNGRLPRTIRSSGVSPDRYLPSSCPLQRSPTPPEGDPDRHRLRLNSGRRFGQTGSQRYRGSAHRPRKPPLSSADTDPDSGESATIKVITLIAQSEMNVGHAVEEALNVSIDDSNETRGQRSEGDRRRQQHRRVPDGHGGRIRRTLASLNATAAGADSGAGRSAGSAGRRPPDQEMVYWGIGGVRMISWRQMRLGCGMPHHRNVPTTSARWRTARLGSYLAGCALVSVFLPAPDGAFAQGGVGSSAVSYRVEPAPSDLRSRFSPVQIELLEKLNRADRDHLPRQDRLVVPDRWYTEELDHSPFPRSVAELAPNPKALVVHLPLQVFGGYEHGRLVRWGPVSSGRQEHPTPGGEFNLNWRSRGRHSTVDPTWYMEWYFNFHNERGLALHQYALPGRPASHACIRLLERDSRWLYGWGEGWKLDEHGWDARRPGTPLWIIGQYDFDAPPPWLEEAQPHPRVRLNLAAARGAYPTQESIPPPTAPSSARTARPPRGD